MTVSIGIKEERNPHEKLFFLSGILLLMICTLCEAQSETIIKLKTETGTIEGSLLAPNGKEKGPAALIIAGSGPVDRDGNLPGMTKRLPN